MKPGDQMNSIAAKRSFMEREDIDLTGGYEPAMSCWCTRPGEETLRRREIEDKIEDSDWLSELVRISVKELPDHKPKKKK